MGLGWTSMWFIIQIFVIPFFLQTHATTIYTIVTAYLKPVLFFPYIYAVSNPQTASKCLLRQFCFVRPYDAAEMICLLALCGWETFFHLLLELVICSELSPVDPRSKMIVEKIYIDIPLNMVVLR